eukprot:CAMPEP_0183297764 /NCGR_PEP_ID=MMETSP0160_2-20130417/4967_1 /TAXON_ID=2839 ORGANISM="Odontella Sinensis, Strain Grunow 1884" /NCGR_SAMPLE_ID=MMETSP0160_2 /ASSEMBLY_ACC=CAM_ASM_000250 /LENGTH=305 /DNA_ID=CAMNT_0025459649 /DNA_START=45 /DNA_END=962 /DNA_ORIENTATION=-
MPDCSEYAGLSCGDGQLRETLVVHTRKAPPEVGDIAWEDGFFDGDSEVIAVFDFDYATMESFYQNVGVAYIAASALYPPLFGLALVSLVPCFLRRNVKWSVNAQHVALTPDGIRFVRDRRKTCWGLTCMDAGRTSKTVPYDKITDCDIEEPAGNTCICVKNVLATVNIDTASSGGPHQKHELQISGLKDPHGFKRLVWAMKRMNVGHVSSLGASSAVPPVASSISRGGDNGAEGVGTNEINHTGDSVALLLREIRDELRELRRAGHHAFAAGTPNPLVPTPSDVNKGNKTKASDETGDVELPSLD